MGLGIIAWKRADGSALLRWFNRSWAGPGEAWRGRAGRGEAGKTMTNADMVRMTEKELQTAVIEMARFMGWRHYHTYDSRRSPEGFPDLVLVRRGRLIFAELKSERGRLTVHQKIWLEELKEVEKNSNGVVEVKVWWFEDWRSGRIEEELVGKRDRRV